MFGIDDMAAAGIIGTGVGAVSSALNSIQGNKNMKRYLRAQKEENEKAYERNLHMWNLQNEYNNPANQMQRLRNAGLNPALAYGNVQSAAVAPEAPITDMSAMMNQRSVGSAVAGSAQDAALRVAQIRNINADTAAKEADAKKTGAEGDYQLTYNQYAEQILTGNIKEQNARVELNASQTDLNDMKRMESYSNMQYILKSANKIDADIKKIQSEIENLDEDTIRKRIDNAFEEKRCQAELNLLYNQAYQAGMIGKMTQEQFRQLSASAVYNLLTKKEEANNAFLHGLVLQNTADELQVKIDTQSYDLSRKKGSEVLDDINRVTETFSNVVGSVTDAFSFGFRLNNVWK